MPGQDALDFHDPLANLVVMTGPQKHFASLAVAAALALGAPAPVPAQTAADAGRIDTLLAELAEPDRADWERVEREIMRIWSRSGSDSMDLLLARGNAALDAGDYEEALGHLDALVDHAPDFAEAWNLRASTYFLLGEYSLSMADVERTIALNPRHFGALAGLGYMLDQMGRPGLALDAMRAAHALNPHRPEFAEAIRRLERQAGIADL